MPALKIHCDDEILARELAELVLAFARDRGLGVEHHWLKGRLSLRRGPRPQPSALVESTPLDHPNVIAFPRAQAVRRRS
jgi:hypothetical protein